MRSAIYGCSLLAGCAEAGLAEGLGGDATSTAPSQFDTASVAPTSTDAPSPWYALRATFPVSGGAVDPAGAVVAVDLHAADGALACSQAVPVVAFDLAAAPETEPAPLGWWRVALGDADGEGCEPFLARTIELGVAPYDARLDPAVLAAGLSGATAYSALVVDGDDVWLAGVAGTAAQLRGEDAADPERLADGDYELRTLVLLPVGG